MDTATIQIIVDKKQRPLRIDRFLMDRIEHATRNRIQNAIGEGVILVNGAVVKSNYKVRPLDEITYQVPAERSETYEVRPQEMDLDIVFEDEDLLVVNKPAGLVVHPGVANPDGTLINGIAHHLGAGDRASLPGQERTNPGLVHRIDKDTSGLLVVPKTEHALTQLAKQFFNHTTHRRYIALVWGSPEEPAGTIDAPIGRHPKDRLCKAVVEDLEDGKHAITHYEVVEDYYYVSLVRCRLETGRTHQIRVHLQHLGHPLFNDARYDGQRIHKGTVFTKYRQFVVNAFSLLEGQALHAAELGFEHPRTGEYMQFDQPLPSNFQELVDKWKNYVKYKK